MDLRSIRPFVPDETRPHQFMRGIVLAAPLAGLIWLVLLASTLLLLGG